MVGRQDHGIQAVERPETNQLSITKAISHKILKLDGDLLDLAGGQVLTASGRQRSPVA